MKLSLFSITAILAAFVAANPILAPRAPSRPFRLQGNVGSDRSDRVLTILPVTEPNHRGYFKFGWFGKGSRKIELFFTQNELSPGAVFDVRQNGYEMVLQAVPDRNRDSVYYRALLIDRANTALSGLQSPSRFYHEENFYSRPEGSDGSESPQDPDAMRWMTCIRSATTNRADPKYVEELYFAKYLPTVCQIGRVRVRLAVDYVSSAVVQLSAGVSV